MIYTVHTHVRDNKGWHELKPRTVQRQTFVDAAEAAKSRYLALSQTAPTFVRVVKRYNSGRAVLAGTLGQAKMDFKLLLAGL